MSPFATAGVRHCHRRSRVILLAAFAFTHMAMAAGDSSGSCPQQAPSSTAAQCGNLLIPRYALTAVSDGHWVYVYGGAPRGDRNGPDFMHQGLHSSIERVNPESLQPEYFSNGLHRRGNHASVLIGNQLISCGGRTQVGLSRPRLQSCEYLDFDTGIFRELPPIAEPVRTLGMAKVDEAMYAIGGMMQGGRYSSTIQLLAPDQSQWHRLEDMPVARQGPVVATGNKLYALGGYNGSPLQAVQIFDLDTGKWRRGRDLPYPLSAYSTVSDGTHIYLFGDYQRMNTIHRYEPATGDLYLLDQQMTPRRHTAAVIVGDQVLVIGGNQASAGMALTLIEAFRLEKLRTGGERAGRTADFKHAGN